LAFHTTQKRAARWTAILFYSLFVQRRASFYVKCWRGTSLNKLARMTPRSCWLLFLRLTWTNNVCFTAMPIVHFRTRMLPFAITFVQAAFLTFCLCICSCACIFVSFVAHMIP
jgi:hypothetical protein